MQGGSYASLGASQLVVCGRDKSILDTATMAFNRLTPVTPSVLHSVYAPSLVPSALVVSSPSPLMVSAPSPLSPPSCLFPAFPLVGLPEFEALLGSFSIYPALHVPASFIGSVEHVSREQRLRCDRVEVVHFLSHANDDVLCQALDSGAYPWANSQPSSAGSLYLLS